MAATVADGTVTEEACGVSGCSTYGSCCCLLPSGRVQCLRRCPCSSEGARPGAARGWPRAGDTRLGSKSSMEAFELKSGSPGLRP